MKRVGKRGSGEFERISWDEALDTIADEMIRIKEEYGPEAFYFMYASGMQWKGPDGRAGIQRLLRLFGGYTNYYGSYSAACYSAAMPTITGGSGSPVDDIFNSKLVVLFGDNSCVTRAGGDNAGYYYVKAKERGVKFISVDPRLTDTAIATAAEWIPINPGTDVALIAAMAYVMVEEDLYDKDFMATHAVGFDEETLPEGAPENSSFMAYIMGTGYDKVAKTPEWAAPITGIPANRIIALAREIATSQPCAMFQGWGWQRRAYGEQPVRALPVLAAMTGNIGIAGGGPGMRPSGAGFAMSGQPSVPANPVTASIPVFKWPDFITRGSEMTNGAEDKIKGAEKLSTSMKFMWNHAGNTVLNQHSDVNLTKQILEDDSMLELLVTYEVAMTPSAKFSDILLPGTTGFEVDNIITGEGHGEKGSHAWVLYNHQVIEPMFEAKDDIWIAQELAKRLGIEAEFNEGHETREDWIKDMVASAQDNYPDFPSFEEFKKVGIFKVDTEPTVSFAAFREDPEANPLNTSTGKIEVYSPVLAAYNEPDEIPPIPMYIPEWEGVSDPLREQYPLLMEGHHFVARSHSTFDNVDYLREAHNQAMWMNPVDAEARGIQNGDDVRVFNDRGSVLTRAFVTNRIRPGNASMPQGAWYKPNDAGDDTNGSINVLTKYHPTPLAKGNPQHTNLVQVEKA